MRIEDYCPHIIGKQYAEMLVEIGVCSICKNYMIPDYDGQYRRSVFPLYRYLNFDAQVERAGWEKMSSITVDDKYICQKCAESGKADFLCALCNERKPSDKNKESYGDPPEFLCCDCYENVSAKTWEEKTSELYDVHKYDWE